MEHEFKHSTGYRFWLQSGLLYEGNGNGRRAIGANGAKTNRTDLVWFSMRRGQRINNYDLVVSAVSAAIALESMTGTHYLPKDRVEPPTFELVGRAGLGSILDQIPKLTFWSQNCDCAADLSGLSSS